MNRVTALRLARLAGFVTGATDDALGHPANKFVRPVASNQCIVEVERLIALVVADCAQVAEEYGPGRPVTNPNPSERVKGRWEGKQAASGGIAAALMERYGL